MEASKGSLLRNYLLDPTMFCFRLLSLFRTEGGKKIKMRSVEGNSPKEQKIVSTTLPFLSDLFTFWGSKYVNDFLTGLILRRKTVSSYFFQV